MVPVQYYFILSALLFFIGVYGFISRRNLIAMLISVELILNAVEINFAAFNRLLFPGQLEGFFMRTAQTMSSPTSDRIAPKTTRLPFTRSIRPCRERLPTSWMAKT